MATDQPRWLINYYGKDFDKLSPSLVLDGKKYAVVKLLNGEIRKSTFSRIGYVLIKKNGSHATDSQKSLFEGVATQADMDRMRQVLREADDGS